MEVFGIDGISCKVYAPEGESDMNTIRFMIKGQQMIEEVTAFVKKNNDGTLEDDNLKEKIIELSSKGYDLDDDAVKSIYDGLV